MPSSSGSPEPPVSARSETLEGIDPEQRAWLASYLDVFAKKYAHELAEKIQAAMAEVRAADWGKSSRSKRPYLQGMEAAKKALLKEVIK